MKVDNHFTHKPGVFVSLGQAAFYVLLPMT
jgi:hypothetical protein